MNLTNTSTEDCHISMPHAIALMTTNSLTAVLGTFGNFLVCVAVLTSQRLRRCSNFLLVSLAVADLIITMACAPLLVVMAAKLSFAQECLTTLELVYSNIAHLSCSSSILHLAAISVDRYLAVVFPLRHGSIMKKYGLKVMLVVVWGTAILFTSLRVPFYKETSLFAFALFAVSYIVIMVSYVSIVTFLVKERQRKKYFRSAASSVAVTSHYEVERRVAFTLAIVIGIFSACWFPLIISFFATGKHMVKLHGPAFMWMRTLAVSNSAMNFLIYSWRIRDFRDAYAKICRGVVVCGQLGLSHLIPRNGPESSNRTATNSM